MKKTIYIIRHGETDYNINNITQGQGIDADLNERGREQGLLFYRKYQHVPFDKIYTSALKRTQQTVAAFIEKGIPFESLADLNEMNWGVCEGQSFNEPDIHDMIFNTLAAWKEGDYNAKATNGENPLEVFERYQKALAYILPKENEKTILICIHGRSLRILLSILNNTELRYMDRFKMQNTMLSVYEFDYATQAYTYTPIIESDTSHLLESAS